MIISTITKRPRLIQNSEIKMLCFITIILLTHVDVSAQTSSESYIGNLSPIMTSIHESQGFPLDYAHRDGLSVLEWQKQGRAEALRVLAFNPDPVPLDLSVHSVEPRDGYEVRTISFAGSPYYRVPAYLLVPDGDGPFPAVVALHDHGGWYYHGKEKLVSMANDHLAVKQFRDHYYEGRAYAEELTKRGFVVIVADAFYWGERRLQYNDPPKNIKNKLAGLQESDTRYVKIMNSFLSDRIGDLNIRMSFSGTTWGGIINYDDRRAIDVLQSLPQVDDERIGCVGLSGGGFRSTYLSGMDSRIKAAVIAGWMVSLPTIINMPYSVHSDMFDAYGLHANLDHPDVASLGAPECATFIQNCSRDRLYPREGMDLAIKKIGAVYYDLDKSEQFQSRYYDVTHQFNVQMQEDAFDWLEKWLH